MGMCAEIIAIGHFTKEIAEYLEYSSYVYKDTCEGSVITEKLFGISEGSPLSTRFALLLGISDPWDFNQHKINNENIDVDGLKEFVQMYTDYEGDLTRLLLFMSHGFDFHFRPEG